MAGALRRALRVAGLLAAGVAAGGVPLSGAAASAGAPSVMRVGRQPSLPVGTSILGRLPPSARLQIRVALNPRDPAALARYARAVATPGSGVYRDYLQPREFARRFGATAAQIDAVHASLRAHGLSPGPPSANALSIPVSATAGALARAFSLSFRRVALPGRGTAITATAPPALDARVAPSVQAVLGLDTLSAPHPLLVRETSGAASGTSSLSRAHVVTGGPQPCATAQHSAPSQHAYTSDQIASAYGLSGLYAAGDKGAGVTVAVYELEPDDPNDIAQFQSCYGTHTQISYVGVDGGAGSGAGSGEAALDIENVIGFAPAAHLIVYQGPNSNFGGPGSGPYDVYNAIVNADQAQVATVSWGQCESLQGFTAVAAENTLFEQAAVQGQTIVSASGDEGSEDCNDSNGVPNYSLAVDDPASQPYVTGVGGTTLSAIGPRPPETAWNNNASGLPVGLLQPGAGGGGISSFWPMPAAQRDAPSSLRVVPPGSSGSDCGNAGGYCREVPDVSADADPTTGYLIYWNGRDTVAGQPTGWQGIGGTSGAAPTWAALIALADASRACGGSPIGFANPALYRAAAGAYGDFNDVRSGNNDFTATNGGRYAAGAGYDMATGLGAPNGSALAAGLCADTARIVNPGPQRSTAQATVSRQLRATDARGERLSFHAAGLPSGLSLGAAGGRISGRPRRTGTFPVTITAQDSEGASATASFAWTIGAPPLVSRTSLSGLARDRPTLSFTITAGRNAPALRSVAVSVPRSLRLASARRVTIAGLGGPRPRFTAGVAHGVLTIKLRRPVQKLRITISYPAIRVGAGGGVSSQHTRAAPVLTLDLGVIDAAYEAIRVAVKVKPSR
jgi:hypothetical protein